jgi:hypothetical protein
MHREASWAANSYWDEDPGIYRRQRLDANVPVA